MGSGALTIGIWPGVERTRLWPDIAAMLQPAADRGDGVIRLDGYQVWTVHDDACKLIGAATTRVTLDGHSEVELVGGRDFRRWLLPLRDMIEAWSRDEGCHAVRAYGRPGWVKVLGWSVVGRVGETTVYERRL